MYLHTHTTPGSRSNELGMLPPPELDTLLQYAKVLSETKQRDHIDLMVMVLLCNNHVGKLVTIFEQCAEQDDLSNMRTIRGIFSTLLLWADTDMIQELVADKHIHGIVSIFDSLSKRTPSLREQFEKMERLTLMDLLATQTTTVAAPLHDLEKLTFLKTHIASLYRQKSQLVNALDRMCVWKQLGLVNWMQQDTLMMPHFFRTLGTDMIQTRAGLQFLVMVFGFALKNMQRLASAAFFKQMANKGVLDVIQQLLCVDDREIQSAASALLYTAAQMDLWVLQHHILEQNKKQQQSDLLRVVLDQLVHVGDYELKQQLFGLIKLVLNLTDASSYTRQSIFNDDPVTGSMLKLFYERYASTLILPIYGIRTLQPHQPMVHGMIEDALIPLEMDAQQISFYNSLCEFLQSILLQYGTQTKPILQDKNKQCFGNMAQLLRCPDPSLKLRTIGFFRAVVGLRDNGINESLVKQHAFAYLVRLLLDVQPQQQDNHAKQLYKELVELFDFIHIRNIGILMEHIVTTFGGMLAPIPVYQSLKTQYDRHLAMHTSSLS